MTYKTEALEFMLSEATSSLELFRIWLTISQDVKARVKTLEESRKQYSKSQLQKLYNEIYEQRDEALKRVRREYEKVKR